MKVELREFAAKPDVTGEKGLESVTASVELPFTRGGKMGSSGMCRE